MRFLLLFPSFCTAFYAHALRLPAVINSNMVLQRDMPVPIWGWGQAGEKVTVSFAGQKKETIAGKNGAWMVKLGKLKANASPSTLTVKGNEEIKLENILVGEVWICSGQSNMEWKVSQCTNPKEEIARANHPKIRLFDVPGHTSIPYLKGKGEWKVCSSQSVPDLVLRGITRPSTPSFTGRTHQFNRIGGKCRIEPWTTLDGFKSVPELSNRPRA